MYNIHCASDEKSISHSAGVFQTSHLLPQIEVDYSDNIFGPLFGIKYQSNNHTYIWAISHYKYLCAFGFDANMNMELSKFANLPALQFGVPFCTSHWIVSSIRGELDAICSANTEFLDLNQPHVAPAAKIQTFLSSAIGSHMPNHEQWTKAYADDQCTAMLSQMISNPLLIDNKSNMSTIIMSIFYQSANCWSLLREKFCSSKSSSLAMTFSQSYESPHHLQNAIFIAFHANPISAHMNTFYTLSQICLWFFWPKCYSY